MSGDYVQISFAHSRSLAAECRGFPLDMRDLWNVGETGNCFIFVGLDGQMVKSASCSWLTMLGGCSLGTASHLTLRAFKLMVRLISVFHSEEYGYILWFRHSTNITRSWFHCKWHQRSIQGDSVRGFVPVKPFIFSDGEVLDEHAQACYYCVNLYWLLL